MPANEELNVPFHQQDTDYYCGAACVQMVLAQDKIGAGLLNQDDLYALNNSHGTIESGWYSPPDGLAWTMNNQLPPVFAANHSFTLASLSTADALMRKIAWTIHDDQIAPIVLVYGSQHWVVCYGYTASEKPTGVDDNSYSIESVFINNPWPPVPSFYNSALAPPPPHSDRDSCTSADDHNISYDSWLKDYLTGVPSGYWQGKFLAVCDPKIPAEKEMQVPKPGKRPFPGDRFLKPEEAQKAALMGLEEYQLSKRENWKKLMETSKPGVPIMVKDLHHYDSFYYMVPMEQEGLIKGIVNVDARFGSYRQAISTKRQTLFFPKPDKDELVDLVMGKRLELEDKRGRLKIRPETLAFHPTMVWKPCRESFSPHWPFHLLNSGTHQIYVRVDGEVFTSLNEDQKGL